MTDSIFKDHFSQTASGYARFRPRYPAALFDWLATIAPSSQQAWDAGTGNGQAATALAGHFQRVVATDASPDQLSHAAQHPRVAYRVARAETSGLPAASCDLVTAAQALHWFDPAGFFAEARRVLRPLGAIAVWSYIDPEITDARVDEVLQDFSREVRADWPPERVLAETGYRTLDFPFAELEPPVLHMQLEPTAQELCGYLRTWSATWRYIRRTGIDPVAAVAARLEPLWPADARKLLRWPLLIRAGVNRV